MTSRLPKKTTPARSAENPKGRVLRSASRAPFLSSDEKRKLILAHTATHKNKSPQWGISYAAGIAVSCFIVFFGWWFTLGANLVSGRGSSVVLDEKVVSPAKLANTIEAARSTKDELAEAVKQFQASQQEALALQEAMAKAAREKLGQLSSSTNSSR